jgi:hypothetical protein
MRMAVMDWMIGDTSVCARDELGHKSGNWQGQTSVTAPWDECQQWDGLMKWASGSSDEDGKMGFYWPTKIY